MLDIQLSPTLKITSDSLNFVVSRLKTSKKTGKPYWVNVAYHSTWDNLVDDLLEEKLRLSDAKTLKVLSDDLKRYKTSLTRFYEAQEAS